jgi:enamine deaminase RidA (YjgF/YER057c/UK114 family)
MTRLASISQASTPASAARVSAAPERCVVKGQSDGSVEDDLETHMQRAWLSLFDAIEAAGYEKRHLVKTTVCVTEGGQLALFRTVRDRMLRGHVAASAYLHVPEPSTGGRPVEIEGELVKAGS